MTTLIDLFVYKIMDRVMGSHLSRISYMVGVILLCSLIARIINWPLYIPLAFGILFTILFIEIWAIWRALDKRIGRTPYPKKQLSKRGE